MTVAGLAMVLAAAVGLGCTLAGRQHARCGRAVLPAAVLPAALPAAVMLLAMLQHATGALGFGGTLLAVGALVLSAPLAVFGRAAGAPGLHRALLAIGTAYLLVAGAAPSPSGPTPAAHAHAAADTWPLVAAIGVGAVAWTAVLVWRSLRARRLALGLECAGMGASVAGMAAMLLAA